jgi:hypothetical protein
MFAAKITALCEVQFTERHLRSDIYRATFTERHLRSDILTRFAWVPQSPSQDGHTHPLTGFSRSFSPPRSPILGFMNSCADHCILWRFYLTPFSFSWLSVENHKKVCFLRISCLRRTSKKYRVPQDNTYGIHHHLVVEGRLGIVTLFNMWRSQHKEYIHKDLIPISKSTTGLLLEL